VQVTARGSAAVTCTPLQPEEREGRDTYIYRERKRERERGREGEGDIERDRERDSAVGATHLHALQPEERHRAADRHQAQRRQQAGHSDGHVQTAVPRPEKPGTVGAVEGQLPLVVLAGILRGGVACPMSGAAVTCAMLPQQSRRL
jgi:hypothetical protein